MEDNAALLILATLFGCSRAEEPAETSRYLKEVFSIDKQDWTETPSDTETQDTTVIIRQTEQCPTGCTCEGKLGDPSYFRVVSCGGDAITIGGLPDNCTLTFSDTGCLANISCDDLKTQELLEPIIRAATCPEEQQGARAIGGEHTAWVDCSKDLHDAVKLMVRMLAAPQVQAMLYEGDRCKLAEPGKWHCEKKEGGSMYVVSLDVDWMRQRADMARLQDIAARCAQEEPTP